MPFNTHRNTLLIAGTDTGVGKTVLTAALAAYLQKYRPTQRLGILKPIQSGTGDRELYCQLFDTGQSPDEITPLYFQAPLAPPLAAEREGKAIDLKLAWQQLQTLQQQRDWVLVESAGGLGSPMTYELTVADLARDWRLPTVLVVPVKLGAIAQAVANVALARQAGVQLRGLILNAGSGEAVADFAPPDLIEALTHTSVLGCLPHLNDPTDLDKLAAVASSLDLERLL
jgi:dethiobiotin synthetase